MLIDEAKAFYQEVASRMSKAKAAATDAARGFHGLFQAVMKDGGALSLREKELVALGIGIALRCDPCVFAHVQKARQAGASREQILETAGVGVMMQGGPAYTYLPKVVAALDALDELQGAREAA
jgi:AhpD family alkylhydroperoxidase